MRLSTRFRYTIIGSIIFDNIVYSKRVSRRSVHFQSYDKLLDPKWNPPVTEIRRKLLRTKLKRPPQQKETHKCTRLHLHFVSAPSFHIPYISIFGAYSKIFNKLLFFAGAADRIEKCWTWQTSMLIICSLKRWVSFSPIYLKANCRADEPRMMNWASSKVWHVIEVKVHCCLRCCFAITTIGIKFVNKNSINFIVWYFQLFEFAVSDSFSHAKTSHFY